ncbi:hypothetical protein L596_011126 [Steinernema carpocapsae]|uniref:Uncharacterized protein n=1 Tax=Steinernema carpocapsae TaxID=34508 RepID=A0A4U5NTT9_STECR|nr:hypothetical protein L596_011126 [Steinernema carpocapsae]
MSSAGKISGILLPIVTVRRFAPHNTQCYNNLGAARFTDAIFRLNEHSTLLVLQNVNKIAFSASKFTSVLFHQFETVLVTRRTRKCDKPQLQHYSMPLTSQGHYDVAFVTDKNV